MLLVLEGSLYLPSLAIADDGVDRTKGSWIKCSLTHTLCGEPHYGPWRGFWLWAQPSRVAMPKVAALRGDRFWPWRLIRPLPPRSMPGPLAAFLRASTVEPVVVPSTPSS